MINFNYGVSLVTLDLKNKDILRVWRNSQAIYRWTRQCDLLTEANHEKWFNSLGQDSRIKMYGIYNHDLVGVCGLTSIDWIARSAEFSLYIAESKQGSGFGKKALKTLVHHGFKNLGLHCIWGESFEGNPAMKMFEDLGFKKDGVRRECYFKDGEYQNAHMYSLLENEWKF